MALTVIIFDETGLEAFQLVARDDCLGLHVYVALKTASNCNRTKMVAIIALTKIKIIWYFFHSLSATSTQRNNEILSISKYFN